jgi:hypothetical protein
VGGGCAVFHRTAMTALFHLLNAQLADAYDDGLLAAAAILKA